MANAVLSEWLNANALRSYPLYENCIKIDKSGTFEIPNDLLVSAQINFSKEEADGEFYIGYIDNYEDTVIIGISHSSNDIGAIASIKVDHESHVVNQVYAFAGSGLYSHIVGSICIHSLEELQKYQKGHFDFVVGSTTFETNCLFISVPMLKRVEVYSGDTMVHSEANVLRLKAGENIRLSYEEASESYGGSTGIIRIDAINGENLQEPDVCNNSPLGNKDLYIKTINGIVPDSFGNFNVYGDECLEIINLPGSNAIQVVDKCAQSCCGCNDMDTLVATLDMLKTKEELLSSMVDSLRTQQSDMIARLSQEIV